MKGIRVTVVRGGEFIHEEIYLITSKKEAKKRCKQKHPEFAGNDFKVVADDYDTEQCKMHFETCCKCGVVFFYNTVAESC